MPPTTGETLGLGTESPLVTAAILIACRLSGLCLASFFHRGGLLRWRIKLGIVVAVAGCALLSEPVRSLLRVEGGDPTRAAGVVGTVGPLVMIAEFLIGGSLGWIILLVFAAVRAACQLMSQHIGFSTSTLVDPLGGEEDAVLSRFYTALAVVVLFSIGLHLSLVRLVIESFAWIRPGTLDASQVVTFFGHLSLRVGSDLIVAAALLALPVILVMLVVSLAQGLLGRTLPEAELLVLGLPVRMICGLGILAVALPATTNFFQLLLEDATESGRQLLSAWSG